MKWLIFEDELRSPLTLRRFQLLLEVRRHASENGHNSASVLWLRAEAMNATDDGDRFLDNDLEALLDRRWIFYEKASGPVTDVTITRAGMDVAEEFEHFRSDPRKRAQAARSSVLQWLYDEYLQGKSSPNISGFSTSKYGTFYGADFTEGEITRATRYLRDRQLIQGKAAMGGPIVRPQITPHGIQTIEHDDEPAAVIASERASVTHNYTIHNSGQMNLAAGSENVSQSMTLTSTQINDARMAANAFSQTLPILGVPHERQAEAEQVIAELEEETASPDPQPGKLKTLLNKVVEIAILGSAEGAVEAVVSMAQKAIDGL
ncbi:hypothetical protein [Arthrobacter sp. C9C5]|uniref:hypothetical protein n=1 Tax=Arthrobacter sp. C9C5 TaxID=2735267 RepID=UPI00158575C2|nr:hypothetical protein [Arthrobacter sp. C9C5]NUU30944.1 hypothetical protein [Arthrobacter sp. C9C5]